MPASYRVAIRHDEGPPEADGLLEQFPVSDGEAWASTFGALVSRGTLAGIWCVTGNLTVLGPSLGNMSGLSGLLAVGGALELNNNDGLTDLSGLGQLRKLSSLKLFANPALASLAGINSLESGTSLEMAGNSALTSLEGLPPIDWTSSVWLSSNGQLVDLGALAGISRRS